jgi:hypothetical protein
VTACIDPSASRWWPTCSQATATHQLPAACMQTCFQAVHTSSCAHCSDTCTASQLWLKQEAEARTGRIPSHGCICCTTESPPIMTSAERYSSAVTMDGGTSQPQILVPVVKVQQQHTSPHASVCSADTYSAACNSRAAFCTCCESTAHHLMHSNTLVKTKKGDSRVTAWLAAWEQPLRQVGEAPTKQRRRRGARQEGRKLQHSWNTAHYRSACTCNAHTQNTI